MAFPAPAAHGQGQIKESGGQPIVYGSIPDNTVFYRRDISIIGIAPCLFNTVADPNTVVTGYIGQFYKDTSGGSTWVKQTGNGTNTGWIAF